MVSGTSWSGRPISELCPERINEFLFQQCSPAPLKQRTGGDMGQLCHLTVTCLDLRGQDSCFISLLGVLLRSLTLGPRHRGRSAGWSWTETHGWDRRGAGICAITFPRVAKHILGGPGPSGGQTHTWCLGSIC